MGVFRRKEIGSASGESESLPSLSFLYLFFKISLIPMIYNDYMKITPDRRQSLEFHIKTNDYFGTLATVLDLLRQDAELSQIHKNILIRMIDDLMYLQAHYVVILKADLSSSSNVWYSYWNHENYSTTKQSEFIFDGRCW